MNNMTQETLHIDATDAIIGRLGSYVAKQALLGKKVNVYNCEAAIMSGSAAYNFERYHHKIADTGQPFRGPYYPRRADMFVRRVMRGMVPHRQERGRKAYANIMCYIGIPVAFSKVKPKKYKPADKARLNTTKYMTIKELIQKLGGHI